jgi:hypothetical protein
MTFRQNEIFLKELVFCTLLMAVLTIITVGVLGTIVWPMLICSVFCGAGCIHSWRTEPTIVMDEQGVRCTERDKLLWDLSWSQIAEVRKTTRYRSRAVQLIPTVEPKQDLHTPQDQLFLGFQLSKSAKIALKTYCPGLKDD